MTKYPAAIHAYQTYQISHSPLFQVAGDRIVGVPDHFWYQFHDGCCDFFVTDTRTERFLTEPAADNEIMSDEQLAAVLDWLGDGSGRIKLSQAALGDSSPLTAASSPPSRSSGSSSGTWALEWNRLGEKYRDSNRVGRDRRVLEAWAQ